jgi:diguanylate cyclase (GGDEF)-like protein
VLSGLLQISNLITQGAKLKEVFDISTAKLAQLKDASWTILVTKEEESFKISAQFGISEELHNFLLEEGCKKIFDLILLHKNGWVITDKQKDEDREKLKQIFTTPSMIFTPVFRHAKIVGFFGVGSSNPEVQYSNDDLELLGIFAKQVAIAIENEYLVNRLQKLEIKDSLTGLYNKGFIVHRLDEEIKRAMIYQRPCAFIIFAIDRFNEYLNNFGQLAGEEMLKRVAKILEENCTEIDRVARYGDYEFSLVLPERNKKQSVALAEDIRKKVEEIFSKENNEKKRITVCGAVSENPIDGSSSKDLVSKAEQLLKLAKADKNTLKS